MAKVSFFANAQAAKKGSKKKSDNKARVNTDGLLLLASIDAVEKALETIKVTAEEPVKSAMRDQFIKTGLALGKRPDNYVGLDGAATASLELRKRSDRSPLDDTQQALLESEGIDTVEDTTFSLNTEVLTPAVMALVEKALNGVAGIPPNLFTVTTKTVVGDEALNQIFTKGEAKARALLDVVGVLAVKPKVEEEFADTLERVVDLLKV